MSFFFIGSQDENLFYLDPHTVRAAVPMSGEFDTSEFQCEQMRKMKLDDIDPCIAVCLLCETEADFRDLCERQDALAALGVDPIFNVEVRPVRPLSAPSSVAHGKPGDNHALLV